MSDNQRSTGNTSQPTGTTQSNGQQSTAPNPKAIQTTTGGGQVATVKYNENWMILSIEGVQVLNVKFNHHGEKSINMGGHESVMSMDGNRMRIRVRGGAAIDVKMTRHGMKIKVGGGRVFRVRYGRNGMTATLSQDGVLVRPPTTENAAAPQPPPAVAPLPPLLGFSDADIDRVSTTFNYVEPPESSSGNDEDPCSICLEPFIADQCMRKLRCGHEFHSSCVVPWLRRQTTCPNCRRKISLKR